MQRGPLALTAIAAVTLLLSATLPPGSDAPPRARKLGKTQKIKVYGYSIRVPEKWVSVPSQPGATRVVGHWKPDEKEVNKRWDEASMGCDLTILRYPVKPPETGKKKEEEEEEEGSINEVIRRRFGSSFPSSAKTLDEYIKASFKGVYKRTTPKKLKVKKLVGDFLEFTSGRSYIAAARISHEGWDWGIIYKSPEGYYAKEWKKLYMQSIKSFRLFEPTGEQPLIVAEGKKKKKLSPEERRKQIEGEVAANPGWYVIHSKNYSFLSNSEHKGFINQLAREIEVIRSKVYEKLFRPTKQIEVISRVKIFADQSAYHQYGGPYGSAGYWNSSKEELVLFVEFDDMSKTSSKRLTKSVMYHEAFHQYIHYAVGDLAPHSWFNEGHGDYFAGMKVSGKKVSVLPFDWRVKFLKRHLGMGKGLIPLQSLVRLPQSEYYSNAGLKYSQGWALIFYLRKVTGKKKWKAIPDRYFKYLRDNLAAFKKEKGAKDDTGGESVPGIPGVRIYKFDDQKKVEEILEGAVDYGFKGIDYAELDKAFTKWVESIA